MAVGGLSLAGSTLVQRVCVCGAYCGRSEQTEKAFFCGSEQTLGFDEVKQFQVEGARCMLDSAVVRQEAVQVLCQ